MVLGVPSGPVAWPDEVDDILAGDLVVVVGSPTPAGGVVLNSVTPLGLRDRAAGTVTFTTSLGFGRKLERIAHDPRIAVAYHTRQHGHSDRPGFVLVQGRATVRADYSQEERDRVRAQASQHIGQVVSGRFWDRWLRVYYEDRVGVEVQVERLLWWPDGAVSSRPVVLGAPLPPTSVDDQRPPRNALTPRVPLRKVGRAIRLQHRLLGVVQGDGMPLILPVSAVTATPDRLVLSCDSDLLPAGQRRAGFLAHRFRPRLVGLSSATHTGWLQVDRTITWVPHSRRAFTAPPNKTLLLLANGAAARWGYRKALKQGRDDIVRHAR